jgi:hypothetical protein
MHLVLVLTLSLTAPAHTHGQPPPSSPETETQQPAPASSDAGDAGQRPPADPDNDRRPDRMFGVLPNYTSVENGVNVPPIGTKQMFVMASYSSFDPYVFPFVGVVAAVAQLTNQEQSWGTGADAYFKRYAMAFGDNTIGNFMTTAVMPTALHQDPRYYVLGRGGVLHRMGYAASRSVVTRGRSGGHEFNASEIGGNALAAIVSNTYHPIEDRDVSSTASRMGMQIFWDTLSNELKEFWPDIRNRLHHK